MMMLERAIVEALVPYLMSPPPEIGARFGRYSISEQQATIDRFCYVVLTYEIQDALPDSQSAIAALAAAKVWERFSLCDYSLPRWRIARGLGDRVYQLWLTKAASLGVPNP
jgi:hypothetical protein